MDQCIGNIFFGNADGEAEAKNNDFENLFYKSDKFNQIYNNPDIFIISGQKGVGKTLLAKYMESCQKKEPLSFSKIIQKNDIELRKLIELDTVEEEEINIAFYEWVLLTEVGKVIINSQIKIGDLSKGTSIVNRIRAFHKLKTNQRALRNLIEERYPKGNFECDNIKNSKETRKKIYPIINGQSVYLETAYENVFKREEEYEKKPYYKMIDELKEYVFECLKIINVTLFLDDVDEFNSKLEEGGTAIKNLLRLINSIKDINDELSELNKNRSRCIILIRTDILNTINKYSSNLNKILSDRSIELYWIDKKNNGAENHELMKMILYKIRISMGYSDDICDADLYKRFFPEEINKKPAFYFMLDQSYGRPREIINYLNIIKKANQNAPKFTESMFREAKNEYSTILKNELINEMHIHLDEKYTDDLLRLVSDFKHNTFSYKQIKDYYNSYRTSYKSIKGIKQAIEDLYRFGIIGNSYHDNNRLRYLWAYRKDGNLIPDFNKKFTVHYGLRKALGIN